MNQEVTLIIEGMTCASCSAAVERVTRKMPGVISSDVNLTTNKAHIVYDPSQVKLAVTGYGKAEKRQVMDMTKRLLKLKAVPRPDDAADALAIALCHARSATSRLPQTGGVKETI